MRKKVNEMKKKKNKKKRRKKRKKIMKHYRAESKMLGIVEKGPI